MSNLTTTTNKFELALIQGDLSRLSEEERLSYYKNVCESLGLNELTRPFDYITFQGRLTLYARKDATEQLRKIHNISVTDVKREMVGDLLVCTAYGEDKNGKKDVATGSLVINGLKGADLANAMMKCETKAKRRLTLSMCGLGILDETEVEDASSEQPAQIPSKFEDSQMEKKIKDVLAKFKKLGVSEEQIFDKLGVNSENYLIALTEEHLKELNQIGAQIVNKKLTIQEAFPEKELEF